MPAIQLPQFVRDIDTGGAVLVSSITSFKPFKSGTLDPYPRAMTQLGEIVISPRDYYLLTSPTVTAHKGDCVYFRKNSHFYEEPVLAWVAVAEALGEIRPSAALMLSGELIFFTQKGGAKEEYSKPKYVEHRIFRFAGNLFSVINGEIHTKKMLRTAVYDLFDDAISEHLIEAYDARQADVELNDDADRQDFERWSKSVVKDHALKAASLLDMTAFVSAGNEKFEFSNEFTSAHEQVKQLLQECTE